MLRILIFSTPYKVVGLGLWPDQDAHYASSTHTTLPSIQHRQFGNPKYRNNIIRASRPAQRASPTIVSKPIPVSRILHHFLTSNAVSE